jgi:hypothetical protein
VVFLVMFATSSLVRAMICDPVLIHPKEAEDRASDVVSSGLALGLCCGALICLGAVPVVVWGSTDLGHALLVLAAAFPFLVLQDLGRYLGFATGRPGFALLLDVIWTVLMVAAVLLLVPPTASVTALVAAWTGTGAAAGLLTVVHYGGGQFRAAPLSLLWIRQTWTVSWRYLVSFTATQGAILVSSLILMLTSGPAALAAVRGAVLVYRPYTTLDAAAGTGSISDIARQRLRGQALLRRCGRTSALLAALALGNVLVVLALPDALGRAVLGATWPLTQAVLVPAGLQLVLVGICTGARVGLFGLKAIDTVLRLEVVLMPLQAALAIAGGILDGAVGFYWGVAAGQAVMTTSWCLALVRRSQAPWAEASGRALADQPDC